MRQGRTRTLVKDLLNDLNAIDCNIEDVIDFSSSQFTRSTPFFIVEERSNICYLVVEKLTLVLMQLTLVNQKDYLGLNDKIASTIINVFARSPSARLITHSFV